MEVGVAVIFLVGVGVRLIVGFGVPDGSISSVGDGVIVGDGEGDGVGVGAGALSFRPYTTDVLATIMAKRSRPIKRTGSGIEESLFFIVINGDAIGRMIVI